MQPASSSERNLASGADFTDTMKTLVGATIAWLGNITSILDLLLFAFAVVVPPAIAVTYVIYWPRTTEQGAFWGTLIGYLSGMVWYVVLSWPQLFGLDAAPTAIDVGHVTTITPIILIAAISLLTADDKQGKQEFYASLVPPRD